MMVSIKGMWVLFAVDGSCFRMYFYRIEVYYPFGETNYIIMSHNDCFDNHQLNIIVQEAFDECIEKYCDKQLLDKGEEACRIEVETLFEKHLPSQLQNHGFKSIKINATCLIQSGALFADDAPTNIVLKNRYKDEILPLCKKCMRETYIGYDGKCVVPNTRKDTSLPTTHVVKTIPIDLNEEERNKDEFNISVLKQYFINSNRSVEDSKIATNALDNILDRNKFEYCYVEYRAKADSIYERDIFCWFDLGTDRKKFEKLLENYGFTFTFDDEEDGFWITGVKE